MQVKCPQCGFEKESKNICGAAICPKCGKQYVFSWEIRNAYLRQKRKTDPEFRKKETANSIAWRRRNIQHARESDRARYQNYANQLKQVFGDSCFVCKKHRGNQRFELHEKQGNEHIKKPHIELKEKERFVLLCKTCHRSVHWCMKYLGMSWVDISLALELVTPSTL
jgi:hypothetical protein